MSSSSGAPGCCSWQERMLEEEGRLGQLHPRTTLRSLKLWIKRGSFGLFVFGVPSTQLQTQPIFFFPAKTSSKAPSFTLCKYTAEEHFLHFCHHALCLEKQSVHLLTFWKMLKVFLFIACVAAVAAQVLCASTPRFAGVDAPSCTSLSEWLLKSNAKSLKCCWLSDRTWRERVRNAGWTGSAFPVDHLWMSDFFLLVHTVFTKNFFRTYINQFWQIIDVIK